jgi:hypothetical protein
MMRPDESTFTIRLFRTASGATTARLRIEANDTSRVHTPGHFAPAESAPSSRSSCVSSSSDIR